jgi:hypothetical protein
MLLQRGIDGRLACGVALRLKARNRHDDRQQDD